MRYIIDIDNTICKTNLSDYKNSIPYNDRIEKINKLYDEGHEIWYYTSRGGESGKNWHEFTKTQLLTWGCKFHTLSSLKPRYDLWVDDKSIHPDEFFN